MAYRNRRSRRRRGSSWKRPKSVYSRRIGRRY